MTAQHGWRTLICTRDDGPIQGPIHLGDPTQAQIERDVLWLRTGKLRDPHWPDTTDASEPWTERLTAEEISDDERITAQARATAREIDAIKAGLVRS